jgi:tetratricopeptide (TPR) repeat protein
MDPRESLACRYRTGAFLACLLTFALPCLSRPPASDEPDAFAQGLLALKQNQFDLALQQLTVAEQQHPLDPRVRNFRGIALAHLGRGTEAEAEYNESIRLDPRQPEAYRNLGYLAWTMHRLPEAHKALHAALNLAPEDHFTHYYLGRVELDEQQYASAVYDLEDASELWPEDPEFLLTLAGAEMTLHDGGRVGTALAKAGRLRLNDVQTVRYGSLLVASEPGRGLEVFQRLTTERGAPWAEFDLAVALLIAHRPADAIPYAERLAHTESSLQASAWTLLGIAEARAENPDRAIAAFREAARLAPGNEDRWLDLTRELMTGGQYDDALAALRQGLASNRDSYALRLRLGAVCLRSGRYAEAEGVFRDLIAHGEPLATTYVGLAQVLLRTGRAAEAVDQLRQGRQHLGDSMVLAYFQGIAFDRAGKPEDSEQAFREAVRLSPGSTEAHLALGKSELRLRQVDPAIADLKQVLLIDPPNRQAKRLLAQAFAMQHNPVEAARYANEARPEPIPDQILKEDDFALPSWQYPATPVPRDRYSSAGH